MQNLHAEDPNQSMNNQATAPAPPQGGSGYKFDGPVYDPVFDRKRLTKQLGKIYDLMIDGRWRTLGEIEAVIGAPQGSISAQLRHLRKKRFGSYRVDKQRRGDKSSGLFEYRLLPPLPKTLSQASIFGEAENTGHATVDKS